MRTRTATVRVAAVVLSLGLVAAACGDDDAGDISATPTTVEAAATTSGAEGGDGSATSAAPDTTGDAPDDGEPCGPADTSLDEDLGQGTGQFVAELECALANPRQAEGEPVVIGVQTPEGDPAGSFPEYAEAVRAAADFINTELGGVGGDVLAGEPGRPIELDICTTAINPADSQRCANELAAGDPFVVMSNINFFGNHFPIYDAADVPVVVTSAVTIADFTGNAFAIAAGGGCLGQHTALVEYATNQLGGERIAVPWADTPPGVVCYYDLEAKPLDVLAGNVPGDSERAGTIPDLEYLGVPIQPATPDVTSQVSQILDFGPDVIIFSAQGADCWNLVDALSRLGWSTEEIPLVLSGACIDLEAMQAAGEAAEGIYFVGTGAPSIIDPTQIENPVWRLEATTYFEKSVEYGLSEEDRGKGFATNGFNSLMQIWGISNETALRDGELTQDGFVETFATTSDHHLYLAPPMGCADAPEPYTAVCQASASILQWDGTDLITVEEQVNGVDLIAGTELKPGP